MSNSAGINTGTGMGIDAEDNCAGISAVADVDICTAMNTGSDVGNDTLDFGTLRCRLSGNNGTVLEDLFREALLFDGIVDSFGEITQRILTGTDLDESTRKDLSRLKSLVSLFIDVLKQKNEVNTALVREGLLSSLKLVDALETNSIDAEILEKLTRVLTNTVLSRESVINWESRSEIILEEMFDILRFDSFFNIIESESKNLDVNIYYMTLLSDAQKQEIRDKINRNILEYFQVSDILEKVPMQFYEKQLLKEECGKDCYFLMVKQQEFMTESPGIGGILGLVVYVGDRITAKEQEVYRSILSLMTLVIGSSRALSKAIKELEFFAGHDPLTGLYNRRMFEHFLQYEIARVRRKHYKFSLMMQDLDDFKYINDNYGHPFGDLYLKEVAAEIRGSLRDGDVVARLGGDEFAVILSETDLVHGRAVAGKLKKAFELKRIETPTGKHIAIKASIGLVEFPTHGGTLEELMIVVDAALYQAKELGKNKIFVPTPDEVMKSMKQQTQKYNLIQDGLERGAFIPYFQPIVDVKSNEIIAYEVLARLRADDGKILPASSFIDMAERIGKIFEIDRLIIKQAFTKKKMEDNHKYLFVNLSGKELKDGNFAGFLIKTADDCGINPGEVVFEITEREAVGDISNVQNFTGKMLSHGFKLAIDDFGSGYSSFYYIKYIPVNFVKIDGEFIKELASGDVRDMAFVESVQTLCSKLGILTVAEFVESEKLLHMLDEIGINYGQGYYLGLPHDGFI